MSRHICTVRFARQTNVQVRFAFAYYSTTIQQFLFRAFSIDLSHGTDCDSLLCEHRKLNRHGRGIFRRRAPSDPSSDTLVRTHTKREFKLRRSHHDTTHTKRERRQTIALITAPHGQFRRLPTSSSCHSPSSEKTFPVFKFSASVGFVGVVFEVGEHAPRD
jgi:hypothetical protein